MTPSMIAVSSSVLPSLMASDVPLPRTSELNDRIDSGIQGTLERLAEHLQHRLARPLPVGTQEFVEYERAQSKLFAEAADRLSQAVMQAVLDTPEYRSQVDEVIAERPSEWVFDGPRETPVTFLGGSTLRVRTRYLFKRQRRSGGKKTRQRGKEGNGAYPDLRQLGVVQRVTPALRAEVAACVVQVSFDEAREILARRGVSLSKERVRDIAAGLGERALALRDERLRLAATASGGSGPLVGQRVVVLADGGRTQIRELKRGRRRRSGFHGYNTEWREPKIIVIYIVDERGRKLRDGIVVYDGTFGNADAAFDILIAELRLLGASRAKHLHFCGDGADWLWDRVPRLVEEVGIDPERVTEMVDFYHAIEHLAELADEKTDWNKKARRRWLATARRTLKKANGVERLFDLARDLFGSLTAVRKKLQYFAKRRLRMRYWEAKRAALPIGSGMVESGIRRIVNLRLKGSGLSWYKANAEWVLHLRAKYLCRNWDSFVASVLAFAPARDLWGQA